MAVSVDIKALLKAGVHFGHKTSRWHPKMAPYIHSKRAGSHIIDLTKTVESLDTALPFLSGVAAKGKQVLFVGTKRQAKELVKQAAKNVGQPYVSERWLGGMLTNSGTVGAQIKKLKTLEKKMDNGDLERRFNKLEVQRFQEEIERMNVRYGGIKDLNGKPGAMFVTDISENHLAVHEAKRLGIPVVAIVDTNTDPGQVDHPIPANDDAIKSLQIILDYVVEAVQEGAAQAKTEAPAPATTKA